MLDAKGESKEIMVEEIYWSALYSLEHGRNLNGLSFSWTHVSQIATASNLKFMKTFLFGLMAWAWVYFPDDKSMHLSITPLIGFSYVHEWWGGSIRWGCDYTHFTLFVHTYKKNIQWWLAKKKNHLFCKYSCTTQLLRATYLCTNLVRIIGAQNWRFYRVCTLQITSKEKGKFSFVLTPVLVYNQSEKGWVLIWWGFQKENPPLPCPN